MDYTDPGALSPAESLDDAQLRRELAALHSLERAAAQHFLPSQRDALSLRLAELDREYLRRFPTARDRWPWVLRPALGDAMP